MQPTPHFYGSQMSQQRHLLNGNRYSFPMRWSRLYVLSWWNRHSTRPNTHWTRFPRHICNVIVIVQVTVLTTRRSGVLWNVRASVDGSKHWNFYMLWLFMLSKRKEEQQEPHQEGACDCNIAGLCRLELGMRMKMYEIDLVKNNKGLGFRIAGGIGK